VAPIATAFSDDGSTIYSSADRILDRAGNRRDAGHRQAWHLRDTRNTTAINAAHHWDDIAVYVPAAEPIAIYSGKVDAGPLRRHAAAGLDGHLLRAAAVLSRARGSLSPGTSACS
jgi:hypothetical protein